MYKAVIIGAGNIGAFYDYKTKSQDVLTHAHAYQGNAKIKLAGIYDVNFASARKAAGHWGGTAYRSLAEMMTQERPDIVSICTPDKTHESVFKKVLKYKPKAILCEKPFTLHSSSAAALLKQAAKFKIPVLVNYTRRWDPFMEQLKTDIQSGKHGRLLNAGCLYTKGLLHNGSHAVDLLMYLLGPIQSAAALRTIKRTGQPGDPDIDAYFHFKNGSTAFLTAGAAKAYALFEMDLKFEKARYRFTDGARRVQIFVPKRAGTRKKLVLKKELKTGYGQALKRAVANLVNHLDRKEPLKIQPSEIIAVQKWCERLRKS